MDVTQGGVSRQMVYNMDIRESPTHLSQLFQVLGLGAGYSYKDRYEV